MAGWGDPLVRLLPRRPGQRDARWAHLLAGEPDLAPPEPSSHAAPAPAAAAPTPAAPAADPAVHGPLAALAGTWSGPGRGHYPTIDPFGYTERLEVVPLPGKPRLSWRTSTRAADDGRGLHADAGFLRLTDDGGVELVLATASGLVEVSSGVVEADGVALEIVLSSEAVVGAPTAKSVTATERTYRLVGDTLTYEVAMAAVGQPLTPHLTATLTRS
ncbi:FABP family protein [Iamia sp. SCSIO 61187]|nr:FABP family protein [Iamia sp. SCSIO 61187]